MKARTRSPTAKIRSPVIALLMVGCSTPLLYHLDGRPLVSGASVLMLSEGWIAVDSCELGRHALVEFQVDSVDWQFRSHSLGSMMLRVGGGVGSRATHFTTDGPVCRGASRRGLYAPAATCGRRGG